MTSKKVSSLALRLVAAALACACAALAGCGERHVPPKEKRAANDVYERRLEELKAELKDLRRARGEAARALAAARTAGADAAKIAELERRAAEAERNFERNYERQEAVCEERRLAQERSQENKR